MFKNFRAFLLFPNGNNVSFLGFFCYLEFYHGFVAPFWFDLFCVTLPFLGSMAKSFASYGVVGSSLPMMTW